MNKTDNKKLYIGEHASGKTKALTSFYLDSLNNGVKSENIVAFVRNKTHETIFREQILNNTDVSIGKINIFRFRAFVNQIITDYWFNVFKNQPRFIGFSESVFMLREFIKNYTKPKISDQFLNLNSIKQGKFNKSILLGIFERQQRRAENGLNFKQLKSITENYEKSSLTEQINEILEDYSTWLISHEKPYLDYALQLDYFSQLIKHEQVINNITNEFNFAVLIDDIDDAFSVEHSFYESLWDKVENIIYTGNNYGSMRQHMGSDITYLNELKHKVYDVIELKSSQKDFSKLGCSIYNNLTNDNHFFNQFAIEKYNNFSYSQSYNYGEMIEEIKKLPLLLKNSGYKASDIIFVNQNTNEQIQLEIQRAVKEIDWNTDILKGSESLIKKPMINTVITILRVIYAKEIKEFEGFPDLTSFEFSQLINTMGNIDNYYLSKLRKSLKNNPDNWLKFFEDYSKKEGFVTIKNIYEIIQYCLELKNKEDSANKYSEMTIYIWQNLIRKNENLRKYNLKDDFKIFIDMLNNHLELSYEHNVDKPFINFLYSLINGEISDNPDRDIIFDNNSVKIMTMQKLSEIKLESKIQIWIDISSDSWNSHNISPYVNPYLLLRNRDIKNKWSSYEEMKLAEKKLASSLRLVLSLCQEKAFFFSSDYNAMGEVNNNDLIKNVIQMFTT